MNTDLIEKARSFAQDKHKHLFRPNKKQQPVVEHLKEVAMFVQEAGGSDIMIAAAWLHDSVEDTDTTQDEILELFGKDVAVVVDGLTDPVDFAQMPLKERKALQAERLKPKSRDTKIVKLCDQISNVKSVLLDPPIEWTSEKSLNYVVGAKQIADVCLGISDFLDKEFESVYSRAILLYGNRE